MEGQKISKQLCFTEFDAVHVVRHFSQKISTFEADMFKALYAVHIVSHDVIIYIT